MPYVQHNPLLNQLLIHIGRSLLQYVGHGSFWSSRSQVEVQQEFPAIVANQQEHVARLAELLVERRWTIDFGRFPTEFTNTHFLALNYLLDFIVTSQNTILAELDEALHTCVDDPEAAMLIEEILASERQITNRLQLLKDQSRGMDRHALPS